MVATANSLFFQILIFGLSSRHNFGCDNSVHGIMIKHLVEWIMCMVSIGKGYRFDSWMTKYMLFTF